jgi:D-arabinose 1-dehydrogenase-like Zn-dependent alcohol dehydrogenase
MSCKTAQSAGITLDGGYAEYMVAPAGAVARLPAKLPPVEAASLMCAGITTFNALRNSGARPGDVVAVLGLGGLGHLGVQYAAKMGFHTVGIARGKDKEPFAKQPGAAVYIDSQAQDPAAALLELGGAKVIPATVANGEAMSAVQGGLALNGTLLLVGVAAAMQVSPLLLIMGNRSVKGWACGTAIDSEDTLAFSVRNSVQSMNETFPLERVNEAYEHMESGKARFRVVLTMGG